MEISSPSSEACRETVRHSSHHSVADRSFQIYGRVVVPRDILKIDNTRSDRPRSISHEYSYSPDERPETYSQRRIIAPGAKCNM